MTIIDKYPTYTPDELSRLVRASAEVLLAVGAGEQDIPSDLLDMAPSAAAKLMARDVDVEDPTPVQQLVEDPDHIRALAVHVIGILREYPAVLELVEQRYADLERKMFVSELMLLTAALVVLAIRVKRVKVGNSEVTFYPAGDEVRSFLSGLVNRSSG